MNKLWQKFKCWIGDHNWTCAAEQGIKPTPEQVNGGIDGFYDYAKMYCKQCGKVYRP